METDEIVEQELLSKCIMFEVRKGRRINLLHIKNESSKSVIFFVHGMGGRLGQFRKQIPHFKDYEIIAWDHFGFGGSDKDLESSEAYSCDEYMKDISILFQLYKKDKNIMIGHSMGSCFVLKHAIACNDVTKIVLLGSNVETPASSKYWIWSLPTILLESIRPFMNGPFLKMAYHEQTDKSLIEYEGIYASKNVMWVTKSVVTQLSWPERDEIKKIKIPTLNLIGETDGIMPMDSAKELTSLIEGCVEKVIPNSSHNLMLEQKDEINDLIKNFL